MAVRARHGRGVSAAFDVELFGSPQVRLIVFFLDRAGSTLGQVQTVTPVQAITHVTGTLAARACAAYPRIKNFLISRT